MLHINKCVAVFILKSTYFIILKQRSLNCNIDFILILVYHTINLRPKNCYAK